MIGTLWQAQGGSMTGSSVEALLLDTQDPSRLKAAEAALEAFALQPRFAGHLLGMCREVRTVALAAATYLRNFVRTRWSKVSLEVLNVIACS